MSNEFKEKLQLYKERKLNQEDTAEIESEIERFIAISDYLDKDEIEFLEDLKQETHPGSRDETSNTKQLKLRVNLRIIMVTAFSVFSAFVLFIFLYFTASKITTSLFGLDYKESYVKRAAMAQFAQMFQPKYKFSSSTSGSSLFAQQNFSVSLQNTLGNTKIDETKISVKYSFGKPERAGEGLVPPLVYEEFVYSGGHEADPVSGFKVLENAPQGTKAKILIEFNKPLTAGQIKEYFMDQIGNTDNAPLDITPLAGTGSELVLANPSYFLFTPDYPYGNNNSKGNGDKELKYNQYLNMDEGAHKESLIGNLNLIKRDLKLLQTMYYEDLLNNINIDDIIKYVDINGAQYVGIYISADTKELLKFKGSSLIHCMRVQNIVIW
jgi:hypothetical protein